MGEWADLIDGLNTGKSLGKVAPHKPLLVLMLLARATKGESGSLSFSQMYDPLKQLLRAFGHPTRMQQPELPFWHLQSDGFWEIEGAGDLPLGKNRKRPTLSTLRSADPRGFVPPELWQELVNEPATIRRLALKLLTSFWPRSLHEAILLSVGLEIDHRGSDMVREPRFRYGVLRAYEGRCAICGFDGRLEDRPFALDAAHIRWRAYDGPDAVNNGLALCSLHHVAFDSGAISIAADLRVLVSQDLRGTSRPVRQQLTRFSSEFIRPPQSNRYLPLPRFLKWHQANVFRAPAKDKA